MSPLTLSALLDRAISTHGHRAIVQIDDDGTRQVLRLGDVARRARALGRGLRAMGLPQGAVVAVMAGNAAAYLEALWGVTAAGMVLHPLNPRSTHDALRHALTRGDVCILADAAHAARARVLQREAAMPWCVVLGDVTDESHAWEAVRALGETHEIFAVDDEHLPAVMCEVNGTVGLPRAVVYSHRALVLHAMACATVDGLGLSRRDVVLPALPLHHANGCGLPFTLALLGHGMVLVDPGVTPARLRAVLADEGVTFAAGVTAGWVALEAELSARPEGPRLPRGLRLLAGGNAAPDSLLTAMAARGVEVLHVYGMTETGPLATASRGEAGQGEVVPGMALRVVDERGDERPRDGVSEGEVQLRAPWIVEGYVGEGSTPDRWSTNGWLRTGDLGVRDARGALRITGRHKPLVRCGATWIDTGVVARLAAAHPDVAAVTVRGTTHPTLIEQPLVRAVLKPGASLDPAALAAYVRAGWTVGEAPPVAVELAGP